MRTVSIKKSALLLFLYSFIEILFLILLTQLHATDNTEWNDTELALIKMNWLGNLPPLPPDPTNKYADNPDVAMFGHKLFFDTRLSKNGKVSCATCHIPENSFTDSLPKAKAIGVTARGTPNIIGIAYSPWFFWDGRSDSLWSQALSPLEASVEHGGNRSQYAHVIYNDPEYRDTYTKIFGPLPNLDNTNRFPINAAPNEDNSSLSNWNNMTESDQKAITQIFVNLGKAIGAYERLLIPSPSRFDEYVSTLINSKPNTYLSNDEINGLKLFIGKAMCVTCHQGPLFTNHGFHNVGSPDPASYSILKSLLYTFREKPLFDVGRYKGIQEVLNSEFNCLGDYSDAAESDCAELIYANTKYSATLGAFKVPTLRNITETAPYFHLGQFSELSEVLTHYNDAPKAPLGHNELTPLNLTSKELDQLNAFLHSLSSPPAVSSEWLTDPH